MNRLRECYRLAEGAEVTIELNPGTVDAEKIAAYKRAGIGRFSIGLQTAVDAQLEDLGRIHTAADFLRTCELIGDANKSADIMIGLKGQTEADVRASIDLALRGGVSHISMYALTPEDGTPVYTDYLNGELPDGDAVAALYEGARRYLAERGFERYEVSNFAKKGFESRHNLNYWERGVHRLRRGRQLLHGRAALHQHARPRRVHQVHPQQLLSRRRGRRDRRGGRKI